MEEAEEISVEFYETYEIKMAVGLIDRYGQPVTDVQTVAALQTLETGLEGLFEGCTVFSTVGRWGGEEEPSLLFMSSTRVFDPKLHYPALVQLSREVARILKQKAVMLSINKYEGSLDFVEADDETDAAADVSAA